MDIKFKLSAYYSELLNQISEFSSERIKEYKKVNIKEKSSIKILEYIKDLTSVLIELKISEVSSENEKNKEYFQLEDYVKKLEKDIKIFYSQIFEYKIQVASLEDKIKVYKIIHQEYESLKEKVKFFDGKFLDNEKKENEILILKKENEIIKKELSKAEKKNESNENLKKNYITKINELYKEIKQLNKKLESKSIVNNNISNYNSSNTPNVNKNINNNNDNNLLSKLLYKPNINELKNIISNNTINKNHYKFLKGLKNFFQQTTYNNKRQNNYNITKNLYLNSNNNLKSNNINCSTVSTSGQNIFTSNYNKINSHDRIIKIKKTNNWKNKNSISMKIEKDENNKSLPINKLIRNKSHSRYKHQNNNKKTYSKINSLKPNESCPITCKNRRSSKVRRLLNKNLNNNNYNTYRDKIIKKSNSALNIIIIPK
jgi:hypothetical protein